MNDTPRALIFLSLPTNSQFMNQQENHLPPSTSLLSDYSDLVVF